MAEYIEREAILDSLRESRKELQGIYERLKFPVEKQLCSAEILTFQECILRVKDAPTADVVPVVRCKDCKYCRKPKGKERYRYFEGVLLCESYEMSDDVCAVNPDDYCSYGERRCEE